MRTASLAVHTASDEYEASCARRARCNRGGEILSTATMKSGRTEDLPTQPEAAGTDGPSAQSTETVRVGRRRRTRGSRGTGAASAVRDPRRYDIIGEHGRGALGRVSRAHDRELGRDVALKELLTPGRVQEARFLREVQITARLQHP